MDADANYSNPMPPEPISWANISGANTMGTNITASKIDQYTYALMDYWKKDFYCSKDSGNLALKFKNHTHSSFSWKDARGFLEYITENEIGLTLEKSVCGKSTARVSLHAILRPDCCNRMFARRMVPTKVHG
eukprot:SAG11_NODE_93_length_17080_cov_10.504093_7_plen_132_part_00